MRDEEVPDVFSGTEHLMTPYDTRPEVTPRPVLVSVSWHSLLTLGVVSMVRNVVMWCSFTFFKTYLWVSAKF